MKQLTLKEIMNLISELKSAGYSETEIAKMPVYIGDDDELNGIHTAWYGQIVDSNNNNDADFINLINEDFGNIKINGRAVLIS